MNDSWAEPAPKELIRDILALAPKRPRRSSGDFMTAAAEVGNLAASDYGGPVRKTFSRSQVKELIADARRLVWPQLNERAVTLVSPKEFTRRWSSLGVQFKLARLSGANGRGLLGFYIRKNGALKQPLICVNVAHHAAAIGAAFAHEMGHHLTAEMFASQSAANYQLYTGIRAHLEDPPELAADVLVSLGMYPRGLLRKSLAGSGSNSGGRTRQGSVTDSQILRALDYCAKQFGLSFNAKLAAPDRVQYLAGLIHYTKLRRALFEEFDL